MRNHSYEVIIVRIWQSSWFGGHDVGHVSLQIPTRNIYASFWPADDKTSYKQVLRKPKFNTLLQDIQIDEGRDPELKFYIFTLDVNKVEATYHNLQASIVAWTASGESSSIANIDNCATFVLKLLVAGGIKKIAPLATFASSANPVKWVPDILAQYLKLVTKEERKKHPELNELAKKYKASFMTTQTSQLRLGAGRQLFCRRTNTAREIPHITDPGAGVQQSNLEASSLIETTTKTARVNSILKVVPFILIILLVLGILQFNDQSIPLLKVSFGLLFLGGLCLFCLNQMNLHNQRQPITLSNRQPDDSPSFEA